MKNTNQKISKGWIFLTAMSVVYLGLFFYNKDLFTKAISYLSAILLKIIPVLLFVYLLIFIINYFINPQKVKKHLGHDSGIRGIIFSILGGILSSGSIYAWYPLLADLRAHGMTNKLTAIFLYNRAIKIPLLIMLVYYFGGTFTFTVTILIIFFSLVNGWLVEIFLSVKKAKD